MTGRLLAALAGGLAAGGLFLPGLGSIPGGMFFAYLAALPIFLVGLSIGLIPAVLSGLVASLLAGVVGGWIAAMVFACLFFIPALIVVWQGMEDGGPIFVSSRPAMPVRTARSARLGSVILWLAALGFAVLLAAWVSCLHSPGGLQALGAQLLEKALTLPELQAGGLSSGVDPAALRRVVPVMSAVLPGVLVLSWLLTIAVNGALAQALLVRVRRNLRASPPISGLVLPSWVVMVLAAAIAAAVLGHGAIGFLGVNALILLVLPFFFAGLAVLHAATQRMRARLAVRILVYAVMVLSGWPVLLFTVLGVADQWLGMRQKLSAVR